MLFSPLGSVRRKIDVTFSAHLLLIDVYRSTFWPEFCLLLLRTLFICRLYCEIEILYFVVMIVSPVLRVRLPTYATIADRFPCRISHHGSFLNIRRLSNREVLDITVLDNFIAMYAGQ